MMFKVLVIGCGSIGQRHIRNLINIGSVQIAAFRTGLGFFKELSEDIKESVKIFKIEEQAFNWKPTHVIISNPTNLHMHYLLKSLKNTIPVFVEKPLIVSMKEIANKPETISLISSGHGHVGYVLRFNPLFRKVKELITEPNYGRIIAAEFQVGHYLPFWHPYEDYRESYAAKIEFGGGALRTLSHEIDLTQYMFGKINNLYAKIKKISDLEISSDDFADLLVSTELSERVFIHLDFLKPRLTRNGYILFEKGLLEYDIVAGELFFTSNENETKKLIMQSREDYNDQYKLQIQHFLIGDNTYACSLAEGLQIVNITDKCEISSKKGAELRLD